MVMVAIILGVGATQALRGLSKIARSSTASFVPIVWGVTLFYLYIQVWLPLWDLDVVGDWNQLYFCMVIAIPCAMFGAISIFVFISILLSWLLLDVSFTQPYRVVQGLALTLILIALFTANRRAHV